MPFDLHFLRPLWFLALLPLPWLLWRLARVNPGAEAWRGLVDAHLLAHLLVEEGARTRRLPRVLLTLGWLLGVWALAGPVWERLPAPLYQAQAQRVIVLDLSPDMDAQDLTPSRLARARFEILDLLAAAAAAEGETALLAYGAEPFVVSPLTQDAATIAAQVPDLETALLPVRGTKRTDLALEAAGDMLKRSGSPEGDIILVTADPERPEAVRSQVARLRDQGYRTSVLGLGTEKGAPVPRTEGGFQADDQGGIRLTRLKPDLLQDIATAGGGRYVSLAADDSDTRALLPEARLDVVGRELEVDAHPDAQADQWREEGPWLLLALLPLAALAFRRGWLSPLVLLVFFLPPPPAEALGWEDLWWRADQQGARALAAGDPRQAAERFSRPDWRAAAQYESGEYDQTLETLKDQAGAEAAYNRGNALARAGKLQEAIAEYDRALAAAPGHADAQHNRELLRRLRDQQQPPPPSSESGEGNQSQDGQAGGNSQNQDGQEGQEGQQSGDQGEQGQQGDPGAQEPQDQPGKQDPSEGSAGGQGGGGQKQDAQGGQSHAQDPVGGAGKEASGQRQGGALPEPSGQGDPQEGESGQDEPRAGRSAQSESQDGDKPQGDAATASPEEAGPEPQSQGQSQASPAPSEKDGQQAPQPDQAPQPGAEPSKQDLLGGQEPGTLPAGKPNPQAQAPLSEGEQAMEHQLRRVPDDPGGLLRQRFMLQHLRRQGQLP
ncbi:MAG: VWA domain-containing protein [Chromatiaceae bacterium]|nr:VWA domain-containing protein [Chromatiaceae bacterium]MBP8289528.1 VWA domain-containing protein [Chromatiaceae bacterium]